MADSLLTKFSGLLNNAPADAVAMDFASNALRVVRMRKAGGNPSIAAMEKLAPMGIHQVMSESTGSLPDDIDIVPLSSRLRARYASLICPGYAAVIKMLRVPESFDIGNEEQLASRLGLDDPEAFRVAARVLHPGTGRTEGRVLAAAMPERMARALLQCLPSAGLPAPRAIELAELAVINAFVNDPAIAARDDAYGLIHFDHDFSVLALFNKGMLSQFRAFKMGAATLLKKVSAALNVDQETASGVLLDGAFDISHIIEEDARDVRGQYVICRDFMERSENCQLECLYVSGSQALSLPFVENAHIPEALDQWNVMQRFEQSTPDDTEEQDFPDTWCWTAAIGGALGLLEQT